MAISAAFCSGPGTSLSFRVAKKETSASTAMMTHIVTTTFVTSSGPMLNSTFDECSNFLTLRDHFCSIFLVRSQTNSTLPADRPSAVPMSVP